MRVGLVGSLTRSPPYGVVMAGRDVIPPLAAGNGGLEELSTALRVRFTRSGRAIMGGTATWAYTLVTVFVGFAATPFLLEFLGEERFGAYRAFEGWAGYVMLLSFGLAGGLGILVFGNRPPTVMGPPLGILREGFRLQVRQSILVLLPSALLLGWAMPSLVPVSAPLRDELRIGAMVALGLGALLAPIGLFRTVLEYAQLGYRVSVALTVQSLVITAIGVWLAWSRFGLAGMFIAGIAGTVVFHAMLLWFARGAVRPLRQIPGTPLDRRTLWSLRWPLAVTGIGNQINVLSDNIIIALLFGPAIVTPFLITQRFVNFGAGFVSTISSASWAGLGEMRARGDAAAFESRILELVRLMVGAGTALIGTIAAYNQAFVRVWVGDQYYGGNTLTLLIALQGLIFGYYLLFAWVIDTQGDARHRVVVSTIGSALKLVLSFVFGRAFGLVGISMATCLGYLATDAWYGPRLFCRRYGVSGQRVVRAVVEGLARALPWSVFIWFVARYTTITGRTEFAIQGGIAGLAALAYCWLFVLLPVDRALWRARLRRGRGAE